MRLFDHDSRYVHKILTRCLVLLSENPSMATQSVLETLAEFSKSDSRETNYKRTLLHFQIMKDFFDENPLGDRDYVSIWYLPGGGSFEGLINNYVAPVLGFLARVSRMSIEFDHQACADSDSLARGFRAFRDGLAGLPNLRTVNLTFERFNAFKVAADEKLFQLPLVAFNVSFGKLMDDFNLEQFVVAICVSKSIRNIYLNPDILCHFMREPELCEIGFRYSPHFQKFEFKFPDNSRFSTIPSLSFKYFDRQITVSDIPEMTTCCWFRGFKYAKELKLSHHFRRGSEQVLKKIFDSGAHISSIVLYGSVCEETVQSIASNPSISASLTVLRLDCKADFITSLACFIPKSLFRRLSLRFDQKQIADFKPLLLGLGQSSTIEHLTLIIPTFNCEDPDLYACFEMMERMNFLEFNLDRFHPKLFEIIAQHQSIVQFRFKSRYDTKHIQDLVRNMISQNHILSRVDLRLDNVWARDSDIDLTREMARTSRHIEFFNYDHSWEERRDEKEVPRDQDTLRELIRIARLLSSANSTRVPPLPTEILEAILFEGFKSEFWYEDQLQTVIRSLLNRDTIGDVHGTVLPLSRSYLFVRCREALKKTQKSA